MANRGRHAKKIDTVHWTRFAGEFIGRGVGTAAQTLVAAQHLPETLLRLRGEWLAVLDGPAAALTGACITMGIIQVPEGTGTTVLWSPATDGDAPWIWWDTIGLIYEEMVTDAIQSSQGSGARRVVDSKAMRKLRNTELQLVVENLAIAGVTAQAAHVTISGRALAGS